MYVFDTSSLRRLSNFYPKLFPSLWAEFKRLTDEKTVVSVKEVLREIADRKDTLDEWANANKSIFMEPTPEEAAVITRIFSIPHFQMSLERQKLLRGGAFADPFVIAKAAASNGIVVTEEQLKENGAKIPNICAHFGYQCINLQEFMVHQRWNFELNIPNN